MMKILSIHTALPITHPVSERPVETLTASEKLELRPVSGPGGALIGVYAARVGSARRTLIPFGLCVVDYELVEQEPAAPAEKPKPEPAAEKAPTSKPKRRRKRSA